MPTIPYNYRSLNNINWPAPGAAVGPGVTSCGAGPTAVLNGIGSPIAPTWANLANAALVAGVYPGPLALDNAERAWRLNALLTASQTAAFGGGLVTTAVFNQTDPTEKAVLSYHLGSTLCALLATGVGVAAVNFMHLSRANAANPGAFVFNTPQRPDYVSQFFPGPTFQIWEAKGRTGGGVPGVLRGAFDQTLSVASIFGAVPDGYVATLARSAGGAWNFDVTDPGESTPASLSPTEQDAIFIEYYRPWSRLIEAEARSAKTVEYASQQFTVVPFVRGDVEIGLDQEVIILLNQESAGQLRPGELSVKLVEHFGEGYDNSAKGDQFVNPNGLYTQTGDSWQDA